MTPLLKLVLAGALITSISGCAVVQRTQITQPAQDQRAGTPADAAKSGAHRPKHPQICMADAHAYYFNQKRMWVKDTLPGRRRQSFGLASWYGKRFHGKKTANGEIYNMHASTAAHKSLPMGALVEVTNLNNGKRIIVRINDRGPFIKGRIVDLSLGAARKLGMVKAGVVPVRVLVITWGDTPLRRAAR